MKISSSIPKFIQNEEKLTIIWITNLTLLLLGFLGIRFVVGLG